MTANVCSTVDSEQKQLFHYIIICNSSVAVDDFFGRLVRDLQRGVLRFSIWPRSGWRADRPEPLKERSKSQGPIVENATTAFQSFSSSHLLLALLCNIAIRSSQSLVSVRQRALMCLEVVRHRAVS